MTWTSWTVFGASPSLLRPPGGREPVVEAVEVVGAQSAQRDLADGGVDVVVDESRVAVGGCGAHVASLDRQPGIGEELTDQTRRAQWLHYQAFCRLRMSGRSRSRGVVSGDRRPSPGSCC